MDKSFSSRFMEEKCKRDINFMYLLEGCTASDHANFARFGTLHFAPCALRNKNVTIQPRASAGPNCNGHHPHF
ncbi:MAG: hypothetical protein HFH23_15665 [Ruminococcus sp.]|nr:hypothetical protein [Ruminococcus sp.]